MYPAYLMAISACSTTALASRSPSCAAKVSRETAPGNLPLEGGKVGRETNETIKFTARTAAKTHNALADQWVFDPKNTFVGATVNPRKGNMAGQRNTATGMFPGRAVIVLTDPAGHVDPALVEDFTRHNWELLSHDPGLSVGMWRYVDKSGGKMTPMVYLDITGTPIGNTFTLATDQLALASGGCRQQEDLP